MTGRDIVLRRRARRRSALQHHATVRQRRMAVLAFCLTFFLVATPFILAGFFAAQRYQAIAATVGPAEEVMAQMPRGGARIYDRNGVLLYEFVDDRGGLRRPVALEDMSEWVRQAIVATEDAGFYHHHGVNVRGLLRAGIENVTPFLAGEDEFFSGSGGSSITQQLAKNVYIPQDRRAERSLDRKIREIVIALELSDRYSKDEVLEWYLNSISFGRLYVGIEAAAQGYFGKPASALTLGEAALLAGIPQSPALYDPLSPQNFDAEKRQLAPGGLARQRQSEVLNLMVHHGMISPEEADAAAAEPIRFQEAERHSIESPHFVLGRVASEINARFGDRAVYERGLEVTTTLDLDLQRIAEEIVERHVVESGEPVGLTNGALVAIDPHTGQILAYVGSRDYFDEDILGPNDNAMGRNSPGSTLKPFGYMMAFTKGWGTGTAILDTPLTINDPAGGEFTPSNPTDTFHGPVRADHALGNSLNIPAIKMAQTIGIAELLDILEHVGYTTLDNPQGYGPALITGGGEVTLVDQVFAYSVLAGEGVMRGQQPAAQDSGAPALEPVALLRVEDSLGHVLYQFDRAQEEEIVAREYTYLVSRILDDPQNFCLTYSSCEAMELPNGYPSAAKTGTSEPFLESGAIGDTWTIGYTPELAAGVWFGNTDNTPVHDITSSTLALPAWKEFMVAAIEHLGLPPTEFQRPDGVAEVEVCWPSGKLPTESCPNTNRYVSLYAAEVIPSDPREAPYMWDDWWLNDGRLVLPAGEIEDWDGLLAWAAEHGIGVTPSSPELVERGLRPGDPVSPAETSAESDGPTGGQAAVTSEGGSTEAVPGRVTVGLTAQEPTTVRVTVDGAVAFEGVLQPGQSQSWEGSARIQVWTDRGRTLLLSVNGRDLGPYSPAMGHPDWNEINFGFTPS